MRKFVGVLLATSLGVSAASACLIVTPVSGVSDTRAGIGLRFEFGDNTVEAVGSVRHTYTDTNSNVTGALAEFAFPVITQGSHAPKIRAMGLAGTTCFQALGGVGYDFADNSPLLGVGVQGSFIQGGANYLFGSHELHPYVGANTMGCAPALPVPAPAPG